MENSKRDILVRLTATALLVLTALLVRFNTQTKVLFFSITKKATYRALDSLLDLVWIDLAAAAYNALHVLRCFFFPIKEDFGRFYRSLAWACYLVDQKMAAFALRGLLILPVQFAVAFSLTKAIVYLVFAANSAATAASLLAVTGASSFQWMKVCNKFTRFCYQIGGALFCGLVASVVLAMVSSLSAYRLFRLYSPKQFLHLKKK